MNESQWQLAINIQNNANHNRKPTEKHWGSIGNHGKSIEIQLESIETQ